MQEDCSYMSTMSNNKCSLSQSISQEQYKYKRFTNRRSLASVKAEAMMGQFNTIIWAVLLLIGELIVEITGQGDHKMYHSDFSTGIADTLMATIKNGDKNIIMKWKKTEKYLANHNLPIWQAWKDRDPVLMTGIMDKLGPVSFYHDVEKSSAIVYVEGTKSFYGVIDTRFLITRLPLNVMISEELIEVNGLYIKSRDNKPRGSFHDEVASPPMPDEIIPMDTSPIESIVDEMLGSTSQFSSHTTLTNQQNQKDNIIYAEVLVFITNEIIQYKQENEYSLQSLILYYLIHFNAVDMLYAKLAKHGVAIHVNIAGIVLEAENRAFPYVKVFSPVSIPPWRIIADRTIYAFQEYLRKYKHIFVEDSFDFFCLSTDYVLQNGPNELKGISLSKSDVYKSRLNGVYDPIGMIITRQPFSAEFIGSAHELAHTMDVEHDSRNDGRSCDNVQCYAILQEVGSFCRNCITWSEKSIEQFKSYISTNLNHCFLLNEPRSLHPYGIPITTVSPLRQCKCFGYHHHFSFPEYLDSVGTYRCDKKLTCADEHLLMTPPAILPVDGTPCDLDKVCWGKKCRTLMLPIQREERIPYTKSPCSAS